ncbi:MBL fold metallo-hydrolase [Virgibacillus sp. MSP4-1]|uniref:MBL fold metallo-hydrolase n=1 Tax=Virgibacillus sp. MSP4-1 TaxID=2700081 RepID=UPI0003A8A885|nr:MBL fold metallo-hydrolase [Virgibacillus sp. MSP4-1]QHS22707.1 MBL fold metallo-hydrolase [Virgibacillus sp. MSP4-1]
MKVVKDKDLCSIKIPVHPFFRKMSVYCYFVDGLLIDTGPKIQKRKLSRIYQSLDIQTVALTHHHDDHTGMVSWLDEQLSPRIFAHERTNLSVDTEIYTGEIQTPNHQFITIPTPAHTPDHVCLLEPDRGWLFSGDMYITPYPKVFLKNESVSSYICSLKELKKLDFTSLYGGHEGLIPNGREMIAEKLKYLESTRKEVVRLHQLGYKDREIVKRIFPRKVRLELVTFGLFSRLNFIRSCYSE